MAATTPVTTLLEHLASDTWRKIPIAYQLKCRFIETTFNDNHIFEIAVNRTPGFRVYKAKGIDEPTKGFDWEWWIGRPGRFWRYSIQAKLLNFKTKRYSSLRHSVGTRQQIEILKDFAKSNQTVPLYAFYNSVGVSDAAGAWHCQMPIDIEQMGCTVVPLDAVEPYTKKHRERSFRNLHSDRRALPWRCLVMCPRFMQGHRNPLAPPSSTAQPIQTLPEFLNKFPEDDGGALMTVELPQDLYHSDLGGFPKMIAVVTLPD